MAVLPKNQSVSYVLFVCRTLGLTFMKMFQPKRPLRPRRKERKKIPVKSLTGQEIKVNNNYK